MKRVGLLLAAWIASSAQGEPSSDAEFRSSLAVAARNRYEQAVRSAQLNYVRELEGALRACMRDGNLDEANRINAVVTQIKEQIKEPQQKAGAGARKSGPAAAVTGKTYTWVENGRVVGNVTFGEDGHVSGALQDNTWDLRDDKITVYAKKHGYVTVFQYDADAQELRGGRDKSSPTQDGATVFLRRAGEDPPAGPAKDD